MTPPDDIRGFTPIAPNPFITGNPVRNPDLFFGREDDFAYMRQRLIAEREGIVLFFVGERRSGKTSILFQILNGRLGETFLPIFADMQQMAGVERDREFFARMAQCVLDSARDRRLVADYYDFSEGNPILTFDRLIGDVQQVFPERRLVFLVDEAEILQTKVQNGEMSEAVLTYMASILENRQVSFCFTGSQGLRESPGEEWRRLTGKGDYREISFLSRGDTLRLVQRPVEGRVFYGDGVLDAIYYLTFGHPFYTQVICTNAVDHLNEKQRNALEMEDLDEVVRTLIDNPPPQLVYAWDELNQVEQIVISLLSEGSGDARNFVSPEDLLRAVKENDYPLDLRADAVHVAMEGLYNRKVLDRDGEGAYRFRVDLFRQWVRRARSIWRLVGEAAPRKNRRALGMGLAAAVVVLAVGVGLYFSRVSEQEQAKGQQGRAVAGPLTSTLVVTSNPGDVEALVNGKAAGRGSPMTIEGLGPGTYAIEVRRRGYRVSSQAVEVQAGQVKTLSFVLRRQTGFLAVTSQPEGAQVQVRGEVDTGGVTPIEGLELPTGDYRVVVGKKGYGEQQRTVAIVDTVRTALALDLQAQVGNLFLASRPPGARVFLNGEGSGKQTPALLDNLPVGPLRVGLELEHHQRLDNTITVRLGRTDTVSLALRLLPATLSLQSKPSDVEIYIDQADTVWARTPVTRPLEPGSYVLRVVREGFKEQRLPLHLKPGQRFVHSFELEPYQGEVRIFGYWGKVWIIDEKSGEQREVEIPGDFTFPVGTYRIKGKTEERVIEVRRGQKEMVKIR